MEQAEYSVWYGWAKKHMDAELIMEHYVNNHMVVKDYLSYIQREERAKNKLIHQMIDAGFDYADIEEIMFRYSGMIQNIYLELGMEIGARLGVEHLV